MVVQDENILRVIGNDRVDAKVFLKRYFDDAEIDELDFNGLRVTEKVLDERAA